MLWVNFFKFHFIGMQIFITNKTLIVITLSHTKSTHAYTQSIEMKFVTLSDVKCAILVYLILLHINCLDNLFSLRQIFICQNSWHPKSIHMTHFNHGINFSFLVFGIQHFPEFHELLVALHCQSRHERHFYNAAISEMLSSFKIISKLSFLFKNLLCHFNTHK
jgi:hypothetical protein